MPHFALICRDKPDHLEVRKATREKHLAFLNGYDGLFVAGPLLEDGNPIGSLVVIEAADLEAARAWAGNDPYVAAGLFSSVEVVEWKKVIG
ncbi:YciI family protein [Paracoccus aminophilus]|uniref:YCII-related domain-containing protein n=1 Tax=Paracoccus aminophilus JCM 7686 TaxID=1367847 RepID=S5XKC2_PARAH|nr:hypothetical protein JCM7686_0540 [Paracoccus aminophilus JCM 7686]